MRDSRGRGRVDEWIGLWRGRFEIRMDGWQMQLN
jgi:hypothetical protein